MNGPASHLSLCEPQLLSRLHPLACVQVLVLAEDLLQLADLLRGELGADAALDAILLALHLHHVLQEPLGGGGLAVVARGVAAGL